MKFNKPPLTFKEQAKLLIDRGLIIEDRALAEFYLSHINYYRLGSYAWSFTDNYQNHTFINGTTFEQVLDLYTFDRELRLLLLDAIERIEISLRTQLAYNLSHQYGSHAHLDSQIFSPKFNHEKQLNSILEELCRTNDNHIKKQLSKYEENLPAIWIICEIMSFGQLSFWFHNLKRQSDIKAISKIYNIHQSVMSSYFHHLSIVRNLCAHHSRLWNRNFTFTLKLPYNGDEKLINSLNKNSKNKIYNTLVITEYLLDRLSPDHQWKKRLKLLLNKYSLVDIKIMGFPEDWLDRPVWIE